MSRKSGRNDSRQKATQEDRVKYMEAWSTMMVDIWRERIERLQVWDTWQLHKVMTESVVPGGSAFNMATITHTFAQYGIYQDMGVGREFTKDNGGDLGFTPVREPRPWFSRAYFASVMVLKEQMAYMYGEEFFGILSDAIHNADHSRSKTLRSSTWGTKAKR